MYYILETLSEEKLDDIKENLFDTAYKFTNFHRELLEKINQANVVDDRLDLKTIGLCQNKISDLKIEFNKSEKEIIADIESTAPQQISPTHSRPPLSQLEKLTPEDNEKLLKQLIKVTKLPDNYREDRYFLGEKFLELFEDYDKMLLKFKQWYKIICEIETLDTEKITELKNSAEENLGTPQYIIQVMHYLLNLLQQEELEKAKEYLLIKRDEWYQFLSELLEHIDKNRSNFKSKLSKGKLSEGNIPNLKIKFDKDQQKIIDDLIDFERGKKNFIGMVRNKNLAKQYLNISSLKENDGNYELPKNYNSDSKFLILQFYKIRENYRKSVFPNINPEEFADPKIYKKYLEYLRYLSLAIIVNGIMLYLVNELSKLDLDLEETKNQLIENLNILYDASENKSPVSSANNSFLKFKLNPKDLRKPEILILEEVQKLNSKTQLGGGGGGDNLAATLNNV